MTAIKTLIHLTSDTIVVGQKLLVAGASQGRKIDATDAHPMALVGTRMARLRRVVNDEQLALLRILVDRRRTLGEDHTRIVSQLHQLLKLIPGVWRRVACPPPRPRHCWQRLPGTRLARFDGGSPWS
ncbi:hypothetical protein ADK66_22410 [Micromonospora sp. NRRL B-16802]|uniref:IS110 family transposase n=1 Tax=Micromonospora sp. NRRL B-16802 TaxID=1415541 RepID=UPI0006AFC69C|nr:transposase [Micromonospora sp. NRRL B-16802]KOX06675.1 hypothetical protein ADK66_22410 [Micromonospora sp. NRRL B-16802]